MDIAIAIAHFAGAVVAIIALGFGVLMLAGWESSRNERVAAEEMSVALGVPVDRLSDPEHAREVFQLAAARFSSEKIQNRLSDLGWWIQAGWGWLGIAIQVCTLIGVAWASITDSPSNAVFVWWIVGVAVFFWIVSVLFALACRLLTGRYPGQARQARKNLAAYIESQGSAHADESPPRGAISG